MTTRQPDAREREQTARVLIVRLRDKAFNYSADPILEEAATQIEALLPSSVGPSPQPHHCCIKLVDERWCTCVRCLRDRAGIDPELWP